MKIFLVMGSSGSWSDHATWPVKAFVDEQKANDFVAYLPLVWEELQQVRPEDKEEAEKVRQERITMWRASQDVRKPDKLPIPHWLQQPDVRSVVHTRASNEMREKHDPNFNGDDTGWHVEELELEE